MSRRRARAAEREAAASTAPALPRRRRLAASLAALAALALLAALLATWLSRRQPARPNLLLVTIDTLRADHLGAYGDADAATPVIDGLARRGARFEHAHSAAPLTGPSHATILTGQYPPVHGVRENVNFLLDPRQLTLASRLKSAGYRTAAFIGAYPVAAAFGFGRGFDHFSEELHNNPGIGQGAERPGNEVADSAVAWLAEPSSERFFAWVHLYDPHTPYTPPSPFRERFAERPYDGEVAFADAQLGRVLEALRQSGHERDTLVVVMADHGEGLGEHGEATHGLLLYESTLRVPLIMAGPGVPEGKLVAVHVGTVDLVPTLLGLLGVEARPGLAGRDLRPAFEDRAIPREPLYAEALFARLNCRWAALRAWTQGDWKLVEGVEPELFDLSADPRETRSLAAEHPDRVERMRSGLQRAVQVMAPAGDKPRPYTVSAEQYERLQSLGYVAGSGGSGPIDEPGLPDPRPRVGLFERYQELQSAMGPALAPALREVGTLLEQDRGNPFGYFTLASLAYRGGHLGLARSAFARSLELDPDRPVIRQYYGVLLRDMLLLEESERELRIAVAQATADDYITQVSLADTLIARGKNEEAETIVSTILAKEPHHRKALGAMGRLLMARGRTQEALPRLVQAAQGNEADAIIDLAEGYLAAGQPQAAREAAARLLERSPSHPWGLSVSGQALVAEGQRAEGLALLRRAVLVGPRRPAVWQSLARGFEAAGDSKAAAQCREKAAAPG